jgi:hypothetical protein
MNADEYGNPDFEHPEPPAPGLGHNLYHPVPTDKCICTDGPCMLLSEERKVPTPCSETPTQEDLLCDECRDSDVSGKKHCHPCM